MNRIKIRSYADDQARATKIESEKDLLEALDKGMHPGVVLGRLLQLRQIRESEIADSIGLSRPMVSQIIANGRRVTPETATLLGSYFDMSADRWAIAQLRIDMSKAKANIKKRELASAAA